MKSALDMKLEGFPAANREAEVELVQEATGKQLTVKPFLDGQVLVRDLDPGNYELKVTHPNLTIPIDRRRIVIFDQPAPTRVTIPVAAELFRDTPIRDIPDADLGPVQQAATAARTALTPIGHKIQGEAIRAADWNVLVGAVTDVAGAVIELTKLVSPRGHDHPEIVEKIGEVQENLRRFAEAFGRSLLELQREIETARLQQNVKDVLDKAQDVPADARQQLVDRVKDLRTAIQSDTPAFTQKLSTVGSVLLTQVQEIARTQPDAGTFLAQDDVKQLQAVARQYTEAGTQTRPESELMTYQRTTASTGGKLGRLVREA